MSSHRQAGAATGTATEASTPISPPAPKAPPDPDEHPPGPHRGPIGNIAAASSSYVVTSIGGMFNKMSEYLEMKPMSGNSNAFRKPSNDFEEKFYDSVESVDSAVTRNAPSINNNVNNARSRGGLLSGLSSYFRWRKDQADPTQDTDNNNTNRRHSSSVDGDLISNSSFFSLPDTEEEDHTSFCEPYPLIEAEESHHINGEGVFLAGDDFRPGQGHKFVPTQLLNIITWCDQCGELIWGFYKQCLRCTYCKYTCHYKCISDIGLDCAESPELRQDAPDHSPQHTLVSVEDVENEAESFVFLTREELEPKIEKFNTLRSQKTEAMTLGEEGTQFSGQVSIHINLSRPVSVQTGCPLPEICISTLKQYEHSIDTNRRRTTFFLPKATTQDLSISCFTTAQDVIRNVLAKLQLIDNPRKFALFERTEINGEVLMRKMVDEDRPLYFCLGWLNSRGIKRFELRENETGVIEWEAFTVPELQNFLRILDKEEEEYEQKVRSKYIKYQTLLQEAFKEALEQDQQKQQEQQQKKQQQQMQQGRQEEAVRA